MDGCKLQYRYAMDGFDGGFDSGFLTIPSPTILPAPWQHQLELSRHQCTYADLASPPVNHFRTTRVAEVLSDFRALQHQIASSPVDPPNEADYYTEGWTVMRQCSADGVHILQCTEDAIIPQVCDSELEQQKLELAQVLLDAYSRRHEAQKIVLRQGAAQQWIKARNSLLGGGGPHPGILAQLQACDAQLQMSLGSITDHGIYMDLLNADNALGRWTMEDPSLLNIMTWLQQRM